MNSWGYNMPAGVLGEADHREWVAHVTHFGRIMTPAMGFASEVLDDPALTEEYGSWAYDILRFFETGWHQFEADRRPFGDGTRSWYWRPIDDEFEPINHVTSLGRALVAAYEITGDPVYARRIEEIIWVFEDAMNVHPSGTVSWPYSPSFQTPSSMQSGIDTEYSEYTWKAAITLPFVEDARRAGFPMSQGVSDSIRNRLTGFVLANGIWKRNIHPYGARPISPGETSRLNPALGGFHMTFPDDSEIAELIKQMMVSNQDIYDRGWFTHPGTARSFALFIQ
ncbi:DNA cytosine methyltransferase [Octadecabacter sp. SW4]|nr:DNA cytosine methyltransferase [Octadecabacter sp. SW4]